ncbi:hypothetical protein T492DRAFT_867757 [Pavlovales sp. CCMP2436]|nr:hypothetical protein T492DRAFT_867757 [Pavlovales sp. CCMP2436]
MGLAGVTSTALALEHLVPGLDVPTFALLTHFRAYLLNPSKKVLIVTGPKGTGKSTAALHAVRDVRGTAFVSLNGEDNVRKKLLVAVGMPLIERHTEISKPALARMCEAAASLGRWWFKDKTWLPTLIVEINESVQPAYIKERCDNAVLGLGPDPARRNHLWVGDFSEAEAHAHMDAAEVLVGEDELRKRVIGVTTQPAGLSSLCAALSAAPPKSSELIVRAFVEANRTEAKGRVFNLLAVDDSKTNEEQGLHFRHLLKDMLKNGGSLPRDAAAYMIPANRAAPSFKEYDAIMFDMTTHEYRFNTLADMHAAAQLLAELLVPAQPANAGAGAEPWPPWPEAGVGLDAGVGAVGQPAHDFDGHGVHWVDLLEALVPEQRAA